MNIKMIVKENTWLTRGFIDFGWGNGYVLIPKGHPLHGKEYDDIDVSVHGGLTFAALVDEEMIQNWNLENEDLDKWCVGFDTCHGCDNLSKWPKEAVEEETKNLMAQIEAIQVGV